MNIANENEYISIKKDYYESLEKELKYTKNQLDLQIKRFKAFDNKYLAFLNMNVSQYYVIEHDPNGLPVPTVMPGESVDEAIKKISPTALDPEIKEYFKTFFNKSYLLDCFEKGISPSIEYRRPSFDNKSNIWVETRINMIKDSNTNDVMGFVITNDITKKKEAEVILNSLVQRQNEWIVKLDSINRDCAIYAKDNNIFDFKSGLSYMSFDEYDKYIFKKRKNGRPLDNVTRGSCELLFSILTPEKERSYTFEFYYPERKIVRTTAMMTKDNKNIFLYTDDITEIINEELKQRQILEDALYNADLAAKSKSDFLARMSHDMRTPLNSIINYALFIGEEKNIYKIYDYSHKIKNSGNYLLGLINDILESTHLSNSIIKLDIRSHKLEEFISNIKQIVIPKSESKHIKFKFEYIGPKMDFQKIDFVHSTQVVMNILNNAIKYTLERGEVTWTLSHEYINGVWFAKHVIEDNGVGISKDFQNRMFLPFEREENSLSSIEGGTGLGLAIAYRNVKAIGGTIKCESTLNRGSKFTIFLKTEPITEENYLIDNNEKKKNFDIIIDKKILICEDNSINRKIIKKILETYTSNLTFANNGKDGVNLAKSNDFDLILMDIRMPIMNGLDAVREIRKSDKSIPIIALSANAYKEDVDKSREVGMNAHLSKPINKDDLFLIMSKELSEKI